MSRLAVSTLLVQRSEISSSPDWRSRGSGFSPVSSEVEELVEGSQRVVVVAGGQSQEGTQWRAEEREQFCTQWRKADRREAVGEWC